MITKTQVLSAIQSSKRLYPPDVWAEHLNVPSHEVKAFYALIDALIQDAQLTTTKHGKLYRLQAEDFKEAIVTISRRQEVRVQVAEETATLAIEDSLGAMHRDQVLVIKQGDSYKVVKILKRALRFLSVVVQNHQLVPMHEELTTSIKLSSPLDPHWVDGTLLKVEIIDYADPLTVNLVEVLGYQFDPGADITARLVDFQIPLHFSHKTREEVEAMSMQIQTSELEGRTDYRTKAVFTIDGEDARDFDDAISIEPIEGGYRLGVHIADVSHYVTAHSALDVDAQERGTSIYLLDRVIPMLPQALSNGICSLVEGEDRLTMTCLMDLNLDGQLITYDLHPSIIKSHKRLTYTQVNAWLKGHGEAEPSLIELKDDLIRFKAVTDGIRKQLERGGMLNFESSEAKFILDQNQHILRIEARDQDTAELMIEAAMIMANQVVAMHLQSLDVPSLYRVHDKPERAKLTNFIQTARTLGIQLHPKQLSPKGLQNFLKQYQHHDLFPILNDVLLRSMAKAVYSHRPDGHFGLGLSHYCHFTSPIRRYPDLIVHRMVRRYVFEGNFASFQSDHEAMEGLGYQTSMCERRAMDAERDVEAMKKAEYMQGYLGETYMGIISGVLPYGFYVRLENTVEGLVHIRHLAGYFEYHPELMMLKKRGSKQRYQLGQKLKIKVLSADKNRRTIDFAVV